MNNIYFLHQIKHNKTTDVWDKGIVVKNNTEEDNWDAIRQSYHAYLGAYAFSHDPNTDYVQCEITNLNGQRLMWELWNKLPQPETIEPEEINDGTEEPPIEPFPGDASDYEESEETQEVINEESEETSEETNEEPEIPPEGGEE